MYVTIWLGVAFSLASGLFWTFSVCCCSGKSPYNHRDRAGSKRVKVEKTPYTYERVGSPYQGNSSTNLAPGGQSVPLQNLGGKDARGGAYEPFRHAGGEA